MTDTRATRSSTTVAWIVYCVQIVLSSGMAFLGLLSVFLTDSCGSVADEPAVCDTTYFSTVLFGYWILLLLLLVLVPFAIVHAARRGQSAGRRASLGLGLAVVVCFVFLALMTR
ncbi:MAG: hypothetical protein ABWZ87_03860 [Aeromicrobium sp.]